MRHGTARLEPVAGGLAFFSSYDPDMVRTLKQRIPAEGRKWEPGLKCWIVAPEYGQACADLADSYFGVEVEVPAGPTAAAVEVRLLLVEYIGRTKQRDNGESTAFGWTDGGWRVIFLEAVLRDWFAAEPEKPGEKPTLYAVLAVKPDATIEQVRSAYRRLAFQWHPDRCHEDGATEQFKAVNRAYQILADPLNRKKYDAGLALEAAARQAIRQPYRNDPFLPLHDGYRSPLRCGWILAEGKEMVGRFVVSRILIWEDWVDDLGRTAVVSWPVGAEHFEVRWS